MKPMTSPSNASDAAVIAAFAGIPTLLDQAPALILRGHTALVSGLIAPRSPEASRRETLWSYLQSGPGVFKGDLYFYRVDRDLRGRLEGIDTGVCPLYLLTGEYDFSCTPEDTRRTAAAIKGASLTIMEQLGHFPMSENPQQFRRYIAPVLSQILGQTTFDRQGEHV